MKKSSFKYWFLHWCAFQVVAYQLGCWKPKFLLHDWEKPWLRLFMSYEKVRKIHRKYSRHHLESIFTRDIEAMIIDWECSKLTKDDQMNAREYYDYLTENNMWKKPQDKIIINHQLQMLGL